MNYNLLTYSIYLPIVLWITIKVGWLFYKNGEIFLLEIFDGNDIAKTINKMLLMGYYLVNIGCSLAVIAFWERVENSVDLVDTLSSVLGKIIVFLALLHYNNIIILKYLATKKFITK